MSELNAWRITPDWAGETAYILAGGTSVTKEDIDLLAGQHVVVVNQSYEKCLHAEILFFADERWWTKEVRRKGNSLAEFKGHICTISRIAKGPQLKRLRRVVPELQGIAAKCDSVAMQWTSALAAVNIAVHRGASRIVLLGCDNKDGANGRVHHHAEYEWPRVPNTWKAKMDNWSRAVEPLEERGVKVYNASPISTLPWWPKITMADAVAGRFPE